MVEIELKFQIPAQRHAAVRRAAATATAATSRLQAQYFDTPDRRLARAGLALRLRQEDGVWVQTLKGRGDNGIRRIEHEVRLGGDDSPRLDLARHAGTEAGELLSAALGDQPDALQTIFATDVMRTHRLIRSGGAVIELAFDVGSLIAGEAQQPLCELEFELKSGPLAALFALAQRWAMRHGLWLDVRSKAERGALLARGESASPPARATPPTLSRAMSANAASRALVAACLEQILPNLSALAADAGSAAHLHQARIGLRRLRTALTLFAPSTAALDPAWDVGVAALFTQMGSQRDQDALRAGLLPELIAAGAPPGLTLSTASAAGPSTGELLRGSAHLPLLLQLLAFALGSDTQAETPTPIKNAAAKSLAALRRKLQKAASRFDTMDEVERHHLRKRLKRLRYAIELVSTLFDGKKLRRELKALRPAQDALGRYHDLCVAEALFRHQAAADPHAWFAVGWLTANRNTQVALTGLALKRALKNAP